MSAQPPPEEAILQAARQLPAASRAAFLNAACAGQPDLRAQLERQLAAGDPTEVLPATQLETAPQAGKSRLSGSSHEALGQTIGRYRLLEKVGEGGCGVVYVAEQTEPFRRRVALKVIKLGMDTRAVVARFEAERQALAMMDHPNIAKVLDAGATDQGRPYFVMELVRGIPITQYCDQASLNTRARLDLFIQVCQAIQHAHQKGIIHRDIKPSNILVTLNDGVAVPKVIDFGIAKATEGRLTDATVYTQLHQLIGTPAYMSPEQMEMTSLDIDTRSDIYSLGVLLYELLSGRTPFDMPSLMGGGLEVMRRTIREQDPPRPSTLLVTLKGNELTTTARRRATEAPALVHELRGDLDWIVMKCLEKDRQRRYETANGLAADLRRYLGNEPVTARPPSTTYRIQKAFRRHRLIFGAAAAVAVALVLGVVVSLWQAVRARRAEAQARGEADRATAAERLAASRLAESEAFSRFMEEYFKSPGNSGQGRKITVAETLDSAARRLPVDFRDQPVARTRLQATLGRTYHALGLFGEAIPLEQEVRDHLLTAQGREHPATIEATHRLASSHYQAGHLDEALKLQEEVLPLARKILGPEDRLTLAAMNNLANSYWDAGRRDEAVRMHEEVLAIRRRILPPDNRDVLVSMINLAIYEIQTGRPQTAVGLAGEVLSRCQKATEPDQRLTLTALGTLAASHRHGGRPDLALPLQEKALALSRETNGPEHIDTLRAIGDLADSLFVAGQLQRALQLREEALALYQRVLGPAHADTIALLQELANSRLAVEGQSRSFPLLQEALAGKSGTAGIGYQLGVFQAWFGLGEELAMTSRRLLEMARNTDRADEADHAARTASLRPSAEAPVQQAALTLARRAVELGKRQDQTGLPRYQATLGLAEYRNGGTLAAEQALEAAVRGAASLDLDTRRRIQGLAGFVRTLVLLQQGRVPEARPLYAETLAAMKPLPPDRRKPTATGGYPDDLIVWLASEEAGAVLQRAVGGAR